MSKKLTNKKGSASLFTVLAAPVVLLLICLIIDYLRISTVKNDTQRLLDDAVLTAASLASPDSTVKTDQQGFELIENEDGSITTSNKLVCEIKKSDIDEALKQLNANIYIEYGSNDSLSTDENHPILQITSISNDSQAKNGVAYIQAKGYVPGLLSNIFKQGSSVFYFPYAVESYAYCYQVNS